MSGYTGFAPAATPSFGASGLIAAFRAWRAQRQEIARITRELETYSDRELAELGLTRGDIPDVARGTFVA